MTFLKIEAKYHQIYSQLGLTNKPQSKETYLGNILTDLSRTVFWVERLEQLIDILARIKDTKHLDALKQYHYSQGDFDAAIFSELLLSVSQIRLEFIEDNFSVACVDSDFEKIIKFSYQDDNHNLCGFSVVFLNNQDKPFIISRIKNINATVDKRDVFIVANPVFEEKESFFSKIDQKYKSRLDVGNLQDELKHALNCKKLEDFLLSIFKQEKINEQDFKQARILLNTNQNEFIKRRLITLKNLLEDWINKRKNPLALKPIEAQIEEEFRDINDHFNLCNQLRCEVLENSPDVQEMLKILDKYYYNYQDILFNNQERSHQFYKNLKWAGLFSLICVAGILSITGAIPALPMILNSFWMENLRLALTILAGVLTVLFSYKVVSNYPNVEPIPYQASWNEYLDKLEANQKPSLSAI